MGHACHNQNCKNVVQPFVNSILFDGKVFCSRQCARIFVKQNPEGYEIYSNGMSQHIRPKRR